jgi:hypothetical protein
MISKSQSRTNIIISIHGRRKKNCGNIYDRSLTRWYIPSFRVMDEEDKLFITFTSGLLTPI